MPPAASHRSHVPRRASVGSCARSMANELHALQRRHCTLPERVTHRNPRYSPIRRERVPPVPEGHPERSVGWPSLGQLVFATLIRPVVREAGMDAFDEAKAGRYFAQDPDEGRPLGCCETACEISLMLG